MTVHRFVLDSDTLIRSKKEHYAFAICPAFWDSLDHFFELRNVGSIIPIRDEILRTLDDLADWVRHSAPEGFFDPVDSEEVIAAFREVIAWVQGNSQYFAAAKERFASGADPWLIAYCATHKSTLVTYEQPAREAKNRVKIPDVAEQFGVECCPVHEMLARLASEFHFRRPGEGPPVHNGDSSESANGEPAPPIEPADDRAM